jgi:hypothetical protein
MDDPKHVENWILRVGDGDHFWSSSKKYIWGINSNHKCSTNTFITSAKTGDLLWFVRGGEKGKIIAVATFTEMKKRETGPLIALTLTNEDLGWTKQAGDWDTEVHYKELYDLTECGLFSEIQSPLVIRRYNEKCKVNLPNEYQYIVKYSKALFK